MNTQELLNDYKRELVRRGLPVEYAQTTAEELADHHRDVQEELSATGMDTITAAREAVLRLGDRQQLVKRAVREFQRRHWCGRWPLLTFLFGPVVLLLASWLATFLSLYGLSIVLDSLDFEGQSDGVHNTAEYVAKVAFIGWFAFLMPVAVTWFLSRKVQRAGLGNGWLTLAAIVLAVNVGTMKVGFVGDPPRKSITNSETGELLGPDQIVISTPLWIMFDSPGDTYRLIAQSPQQICQLLVPLVAAFVLIAYNGHRSRCALPFVREHC